MTDKPRVIIVDVRNGKVWDDGGNIDRPADPYAIQSALDSIATADVLVEVHADGIFVKQGVDKGWVTMITTKSTLQLNAEKAANELEARVGSKPNDDLEKGDHPLTKFARAWEGPSNSGTVDGGLKGY